MITALIIEDEEPSRLLLRNYLMEHSNYINLLGEAKTGKEAIELINKFKPQLIFLDIHLPDMNGFDILSFIKVPSPFIVFTTAYNIYALKAFELLSIEYLVKPIASDRFEKAISKLKQLLLNNNLHQFNPDELRLIYERNSKPQLLNLTVKLGNAIILIDLKNISHIISDDKYVLIHTLHGKKFLCDKTLQSLEEMLPESFLRIHRSNIINTNHIKFITKDFKSRYVFVMNDCLETKIQSSSTYKDQIKIKLGL